MKTKTPPTLETIERLLDEVDEWYGRVRKIRKRLGCNRAAKLIGSAA
jgi:hypothetical protein